MSVAVLVEFINLNICTVPTIMKLTRFLSLLAILQPVLGAPFGCQSSRLLPLHAAVHC